MNATVVFMLFITETLGLFSCDNLNATMECKNFLSYFVPRSITISLLVLMPFVREDRRLNVLTITGKYGM